jgi:PQQ-dependent dehydrogenase (methanol/ethanol family)
MNIMTPFSLSLCNWLKKSMRCVRVALILALLIPLYSFGGTQDWLNIHGGLSGWHFSALNEINSNNVSRLRTAWSHEPENVTEELTSFPVAAGGLLAYCAEADQIWVLDGATGKVRWHTKVAETGESSVLLNSGCRGLAIDQGVLFFAGGGGRVIAFNLKNGAIRWDVRMWPKGARKSNLNGPPLIVRDRLIVGTTPSHSEHGELIGLDIKTGSEIWRLDLVGGPNILGSQARWNALDTWSLSNSPSQSIAVAGVAASMPGAYDDRSGTLYWGTGSPYPLFDHAGSSFKTHGIRPGDNLYSAGLLGIDPMSGEIRFWHQELPHENWVLDSAQSESLLIERKGMRYIVHPNRTGYVFVYGSDLRLLRVWQASKNSNFVSGFDQGTGALKERKDFNAGEQKGLCPLVDGVFPGLPGAYSPKTGLIYKIVAEWCMDVSLDDPAHPDLSSQHAYLGGKVTPIPPQNERARGHLDARDPLTGSKVWTVDFPEPPLASILATSGGLVFVADGRGSLQALNAGTGIKLWSDNQQGGYAGGVMSYEADGHQFIVVVSGWDVRRHPAYAKLFGAPFYNDRPTQSVLRAYRLH